jgi:type II secretory pathway component PulK
MALILALGAIALAGGLAFWMQARSLGALRTAERDLTVERLRAAGAEAVRAAMLTLREDDDYAVDSEADVWAQPRSWTTEDGIALRTVTEDAGRWFDWNNLAATNDLSRTPRAVLLDLMAACGRFDADAGADALRDYVDADAEGPYEAAFYRIADRPFAPPDRLLWAPDELLDVHDFPPELFLPRRDARPRAGGWTDGDLTASCVLVPSGVDASRAAPLPVNLNTASRAVLMGVFGPERESAVSALLAIRSVQPLESAAMLSAVDPAATEELGPWVAVASSYFRITAHAALTGACATVMAWVERGADGSMKVLQWLETGGPA